MARPPAASSRSVPQMPTRNTRSLMSSAADDRRLRAIDEADGLRSRDDGNGFHALAFGRSVEAAMWEWVVSRNSAKIRSTIAPVSVRCQR